MLPPKGTPCRECPFRRVALVGYTGAAPVQEFAEIAYHGEIPMPCHLAIDYENPAWQAKLARVPQCSGHAITLANSCKFPRNKEVQLLPVDHDLAFSFKHEFLSYHLRLDDGKKPKKKRRKRG